MKIEPHNITIRDLVADYEDNGDGGVVGYGNALDIRPPYQREFVYKDKQRDMVIDTVMKGYPLNVMYWAVRDDVQAKKTDRLYEVMDGQQRTISICQYVEGDFSFAGRYFHNLQQDEREQILNYELKVYLCSGTDSEKLEWFKTINIAGVKLTNQELRNAVYHGTWVSDAKRYFSRQNTGAHGLASNYVNGDVLRQEYLEEAIEWINDGDVEGYMALHQHDPNANELWLYFQSVVAWVKATFPPYRGEMKSVKWGPLYNNFKGETLDAKVLEAEVARLMADEDVTNKKGIYSYLLDGQEKHLNIRAFSPNQKREAWERQQGKCVKCGKTFAIGEMEGDHITPWHEGGKTEAANCQMLCVFDNRSKGKK